MSSSLLVVFTRDMDFIEDAIVQGKASPYEIVERCMSPFLREEIGAALYAYSANQDALTDNEEH